MPLHFQVNHCGPAANAEGQLFCSLRHQLPPKGMATGNREIEFSFTVLCNNRREWWMTNDGFPMDQLGEGGFSSVHCSTEQASIRLQRACFMKYNTRTEPELRSSGYI